MGFRAQADDGEGNATDIGSFSSDQCFSNVAPSRIHCSSKSFSSAVRDRFESTGGMRSSSFVVWMRLMSSLLVVSPGTIPK